MQAEEERFQIESALVRGLLVNGQDSGFKFPVIQNLGSIVVNMHYHTNPQPYESRKPRKWILPIIIITVVLGALAAGVAYYMLAGQSWQNSILTVDAKTKLQDLLERRNLRFLDFEKSDFQFNRRQTVIDERLLAQLSMKIQDSKELVLLIKSGDHIFGVYNNKRQLLKSFLFSVNNQKIFGVDKSNPNHALFPLIKDNRGPQFGRTDLQIFSKKQDGQYMSQSHICHSYSCDEQGIQYTSPQAQTILAGAPEFSIDYMILLVRNNRSIDTDM